MNSLRRSLRKTCLFISLMIFIVIGGCSSDDDEPVIPPAPRMFDFPNGIFVEATMDGEKRSIVQNFSAGLSFASFSSNVMVGNECEPAYGGGLREASSDGFGGGIFIVFYGAARAYGDTDACANSIWTNFVNYFPTGIIPVNDTQQRLDTGLTGGISFLSSFDRNFHGTSSTSYSHTQVPYPQPNSTFEILNTEEKISADGFDLLEVEGIFDNITLYDQGANPVHLLEDGSFRVQFSIP